MFFSAALANTVSAINVAAIGGRHYIVLPVSKFTISVLYRLVDINVLSGFNIITQEHSKRTARLTLSFKNGKPNLKRIKLISTGAKNFTIGTKALKIFTSKDVNAKYIISTSKGIFTEQEAMQHNVGGVILLKLH